jgi:NADH-quinone oxidoreductase subunit M
MTAIILLILPVAAAILTWLSGNKWANRTALISSLPAFLITAKTFLDLRCNDAIESISFSTLWVERPLIYFNLEIDGLAIVMLGLTNFLVPIIILSGIGATLSNSRTFYALILLMQAALNGVFMASDGFVYYVFWELALIPIYFIAFLWGAEDSRKITFKFFVYTLAGSLFMLLAFIFLYLKGRDLTIDTLYNLSLSPTEQTFVFLAFFLAFAIKIPVFPFHTWQPDTYTAAPSQGTMLLSGIMLKMGLYSLLRWLLPVVPFAVQKFVPVVMVLSIIGVVYGSWIAIQQNNLKRLLAYSSFAHVGLIAAGTFSLTSIGLTGSVVQMVSHGINVVGLFIAAEIIFRRTGTHEIGSLGGIRNVAPAFHTYFFILLLGSVALPLTNGFVGEFMLLFGVWQYNTSLGAIAGTTIILGAVYLLRMFQRTMLGTNNVVTKGFKDLSLSEHLSFLPLVFLVFFLGLFPNPVINMAKPVIENILSLAIK